MNRYSDDGSTLGPAERTVRRRRDETFTAAQEIHGGSSEDKRPGEIGLVDTVLKKCDGEILSQEMARSSRVKKIIPKIQNKDIASFEKTEDNLVRSVSVYYSGGVMGKRKYRAVYRDSCSRKLGG